MSAPTISKLMPQSLTSGSVLVLETRSPVGIAPLVLTPGEWAVGAGSQCRIVLPTGDADEVHAQLSVSEHEVAVYAWGEGVRVNGVEVGDAVLTAGDRLEIGRVEFQLREACAADIIEQVPDVPTQSVELGRTPAAESLLRRIGEIADTLDALEQELHGRESTCDRLDQAIDRIQKSLAQQGTAKSPVVEDRRDDSLRAIREQLDQLAISIESELKSETPRPASLRASPSSSSSASRLDEVLSQVQPVSDYSDDWADHQTAVATRMTAQLTRMFDFSQQLCARAAVLDEEAVGLSAQWADLRLQQEELSLQRELLNEETIRFHQRLEVERAAAFENIQRWSETETETVAVQSGYGGANVETGLGVCVSTGGNGGDGFGRAGDIAASGNWHLDDRADGDWSLSPAERRIAVSEPAAVETAGSNSYDSGRSFEPVSSPSSPLNAFADESVGDEELALAVNSAIEIAVVEDDIPAFEDHSVVTDELEAEPVEQVEQLQQLVRDIELEVEDCLELDAAAEIEDGETIDELPVGVIDEPQTVDRSEGPALEGFSESRSREAAVAELDALLAAYAHESVAELPAVDLEQVSEVEAIADDDAEGVSESTLELASGETWYEGQPLEGESEFQAEQAAEVAVQHVEEQAAESVENVSVDTAQRAEELIEETEQLLDSLKREPIDSFATEPVQSAPADELVAAESVGAPEASMFSQSFSVDVEDHAEDAEIQRGGLFGASGESATDVPTGSLLAQLERKPTEHPETEKLSELRSQLADLFGMKSQPVERPEPVAAKPLEERFSSFYQGGKSIEQLDQQGALTEASNPIAEEVLSRGSSEEETVEPTPVEKAAPVVASSDTSAADPDDPIRAYMAQLIARNRQSSKTDRSEEKTIEKRTEGTSTIEGYSTLAYEALPDKKTVEQDYSYLSEGPKHKQDKDAVRASMTQLRQLANMQARTAVAKAGRKQLKLQVVAKLGGTLMSFAFGATAIILKMPAIYGYVVCALGMLFACDLFITVLRNWKLLAKQSKLARESTDSSLPELKVDPRTEGRLEQFTKASRQ